MKARLVRNKANGQSIPIIALMIVVLVALVGLAADVGQTYAEQRNTQRASNAAALAGMNTLIKNGDDGQVNTAIKNSLKSNNIIVAEGPQPQPGERVLVAYYLDASGAPLRGCEYVGKGCSGSQLQSARYLKVTVTGKVDTYFARVVGRNDLPVGANAWAGRGVCLNIYPIGVYKQMLGPNGFVNPDPAPGGTYNDSNYRNKTVKSLPLHDPSLNPPGGFDWLRWSADAGDKERGANATATEAMMTGPGNITGGFNEVEPWPTTNGLNIPKPDGYPISPGQLNAGDWVYPNPGLNGGAGVKAQLDKHIANKDVLVLPIWDDVQGSGNTAQYHVAQLGAFIMLGYQLTGQGYFKLAYLGDPPECSTLQEPPLRTGDISIAGPVLYRPRWKEQPSAAVAVQYEIILDVSGSMTWNYAGQGNKSKGTGSVVQCTGSSAYSQCSGLQTPWKTVEERRIYFAKNAIKSFIGQMKTNDVMRIVSFSGGPFDDSPYTNSRAITDFTDAYPTDTSVNKGWSSDKTVLKKAVDDAGSQGNTYLTEGRTPTADGIARGTQEFSKAPTKTPDGATTYKRVVILLTDGVANIRLNGTQPDYSKTPGCGSEIPGCNSGTDDMPINAAGIEAIALKDYAQVYVIAMAGVSKTGLDTIAQEPRAPFFSTSENGGDLAGILADINKDVREGTCVPDGGTNFLPSMKDTEIGSTTLGTVGYPTVGYVTLLDENHQPLPNGKSKAPIQMDSNGNLSYRYDKLTPGIYEMSAWITYKGPDGVSHDYNQIYNKSTALASDSQPLIVDSGEALGTVVPIAPVNLDMIGGPCAGK